VIQMITNHNQRATQAQELHAAWLNSIAPSLRLVKKEKTT
jgi:hypothetical protein